MGNVTPWPHHPRATTHQTGFDRHELARILDLYGRMVAAGKWRDYAMDFHREVAIFSAFRRAAERPEYRIEKRPALRQRQGMWALVRSEEHTSELQSLMRISYAVFCLKKKKINSSNLTHSQAHETITVKYYNNELYTACKLD